MNRPSTLTYSFLLALTAASFVVFPLGIVAALSTGDWRWLIGTLAAGLFLWRLVK